MKYVVDLDGHENTRTNVLMRFSDLYFTYKSILSGPLGMDIPVGLIFLLHLL